MSLSLSVKVEWKEKESDHTLCCECGQMIIGNMWQMVLVVNGEEMLKEDKLCKYCYVDESGKR